MENPFKYGVTSGCLLNIHLWSPYRLLMFCWILRHKTIEQWLVGWTLCSPRGRYHQEHPHISCWSRRQTILTSNSRWTVYLSGYLTLYHVQRTPSSQETQLWKGLWSLHTPNKVKNHIWRACRNSLPTEENLLRRTIITSSTCDHCQEHAESPLHAMWSCSKLDEAWNRSCGASIEIIAF